MHNLPTQELIEQRLELHTVGGLILFELLSMSNIVLGVSIKVSHLIMTKLE